VFTNHIVFAPGEEKQNENNSPLFGVEVELEYKEMEEMFHQLNDPAYWTEKKKILWGTFFNHTAPTQILSNSAEDITLGWKLIKGAIGNWKVMKGSVVASQMKSKSFCLTKRDGSIDGIEFVTRPGTFNAQKLMITHIMKEIRESDIFRATAQCGIHIHTSRKTLTELQIRRIKVLLSQMDTNHMLKIAGRVPNHYCGLEQHNKENYRKFDKTAKDIQAGSRYVAANITEKTLEFRMFASSVQTNTVLKHLEVVKAILDFTRETPAKDWEKLTPENFFLFAKNKKEYPILSETL
jgi:hypothetical protein